MCTKKTISDKMRKLNEVMGYVARKAFGTRCDKNVGLCKGVSPSGPGQKQWT